MCTASWHGAEFNHHIVFGQMLDSAVNRPRPDETKIATARWYGNACDWLRSDAGAMHVEAHGAELVHPALALLYHLGAHHVAVEGIGAFPLMDVDDTMVQNDLPPAHLTAPKVRPLTRYFWITQVRATMGAIIAMVAAQIAPI